jgi:hypothetical protein
MGIGSLYYAKLKFLVFNILQKPSQSQLSYLKKWHVFLLNSPRIISRDGRVGEGVPKSGLG